MSDHRYLALMTAAHAHAKAHHARTPVLAPYARTLLGKHPPVNVAELRTAGFRVIPWTVNSPAEMRALMALHVDGIISDRPDILQTVLKKEAATNSSKAAYFAFLDVTGHRGARGLRPENTLPAFEAGLDNLVTSLETDIGISADGVPLIWHDQFFTPESCRRSDGTRYTLANRIYLRDITSAEAQRTLICDKLHRLRFPSQTNDLALSPVSVAFAKHEHLVNPYVPTHIEQLFHFTRYYSDHYRLGLGKSHPAAEARAQNAERVCFNIETKILPIPNDPEGGCVEKLPIPRRGAEPTTNHTAPPETFVTALHEVIQRNHMQIRSRILSFDFRILQLAEEQFPYIPTYYLTESPASLSTALLPPDLRQH